MQKANCVAHGAKVYYRPIEAAIRWANLLRFELKILEMLGSRAMPEARDCSRWPRLYLFTERIFDAIAHGDLPYEAGIVQTPIQAPRCPPLNDPTLTVRHIDLKAWMTQYYPGERPPFLFDNIERELHPAVSLDAVNALLADREACKTQLAGLAQEHTKLRAEYEALTKNQGDGAWAGEPGPRSEITYLNIIGALLRLLLGESPTGTAYSSFRSLNAVISAVLTHYDGLPGLSERTLWSKLGQAQRHLETAR